MRVKKKRNWTQEELELLSDNWGTVSIVTIARKLDRTEGAVINKARRIGLGPFLDSSQYVSWNQLLRALGYKNSSYKTISWIENRDFPIRTKRVKDCSFKVVDIDEFWEWAEQNKAFIDFSRFEEFALGKEPEWVKEKRWHDINRNRKYITTPWTITEDEKLKYLVNQYKYYYSDISRMMRRTESAIQRRCNDLGLKGRPLRRSPHSKWENWQLEMLDELIDLGYSYEYMSEEIGKSTKAIRGKVYVLYGTEILDKVRERRKHEQATA